MKIAGKELSEETIKKACEQYGISFERKFKKIVLCGFSVEADFPYIRFTKNIHCSALICRQSIEEAKKSIAAIQSAIAFVQEKEQEKNK